MGFWSQIIKARPNRRPNDEPARPGVAFGSSGRRLITWNQHVAAETALNHPALFRCLKKIGDAVGSVDWYAEVDPQASAQDRSDKSRIIADLNSVLKSPSDSLSPHQLRFWMGLVFAAYGRVPVKIGTGTMGNVNGIYPLDPKYVTAEMDRRGVVDRYKFGLDGYSETLPTRKKANPQQSYAYEIFLPGLSGTQEAGKSLTPLNSLGIPAEIISSLLLRALGTAQGHPNSKYIVATEKTLTEAQYKALREHLDGSAPDEENSGNVAIFRNAKIDVIKLDNDLNNIHAKMPLDDMTRIIAGAFGIPISLIGLGAADGAKFAGNFEESRLAFWEDTIDPGYLTPIETGMTQAICPPGVRIKFDRDSIPAIQQKRIKQAKDLNGISFMTANEKREAIDFARLAGKEHDSLPAINAVPPIIPPAQTEQTGDDQ